jgi:mRNA interferase RelE/StbE
MSYSLQFKPAVEKDLKSLSQTMLLRLFKQIFALQSDPLPHQSIKLSGMEHLYRIRIGDYRVVYEVDEKAKIVIIHYVRHRRDVYRQL